MTDANRVSELDLLAWADGLLDDDPGRKAAVEAALESDPELRARAEAFCAQTRALRAAYDRRLAEPVPERLLAMLERPARPRAGPALRAAAVALLVAGAGVAGWQFGQDGRPAGWSAEALVERAYAQFIADRPGAAEGAVEPALGATATDAQPLGWLADEISIRLKAPNLTEAGFRLVAKEAVEAGDGQIVRLDYAGAGGQGFSLFLAPRWESRAAGIAQVERGGVSMAFWLDGPLASTVVAQMPAAETRALAETVRRAMHTGSAPATLEPVPAGRGVEGLEAMAGGTPTPAAGETRPQLIRRLEDGPVLPR